MRRDTALAKPIKSSFLSCEKDAEEIIKKLFVSSQPYSDLLKRLLIILIAVTRDTNLASARIATTLNSEPFPRWASTPLDIYSSTAISTIICAAFAAVATSKAIIPSMKATFVPTADTKRANNKSKRTDRY